MALIVAGLAGSGGVSAAGLAVLLGADVGSAIASGLFASGSSVASTFAPLLLFAGYLTFSFSVEFRPRNVGRVLIGLGLMLFALTLIAGATAPLREATLFHYVLAAVAGEPVLGFLVGAMLAWMCHSTLGGASHRLAAGERTSRRSPAPFPSSSASISAAAFPPSQRRWTSLRRLDGCLWRTCFAAGSPHSP